MISQGWSMDSNPVCHPSPAKKIKCSFLDYIQLLMISWAGRWTQTSTATPLQPKKLNAHFWITFNFWWTAGLVNGLKPHPPPLSSQKNKMLIFGLRSTSDDQLGWSMDSNPICHTASSQKKLSACFWITFNFWWSARLVKGLEPRLPPLSSQKNKILIFGLHSISDDRLGWSMDLNPICHPSPAKKIKCFILDYVQLLMIGWAGQWTRTLSTTPLQPKNEMLIFGLCSTSDDRPGWSMDSSPICHPSPAKRIKCSFLDYIQILMISRAGQWTRTLVCHPSPAKKIKCFIFGLRSTSDDQPCLVDGLKPRLPPLSSQKNESACFWITFNFWWFSWPGQCTQTLSATPLQPKK